MPESNGFQVMPPLSAADYEALKADIAERGVMIPIEVDEEGNVLDGHHRLQIAEELGVKCPRFQRFGLSEQEKRTHARQLNIARRHLNQEQKRALIEAELREQPERSNNAIAGALGVDDKTVGSVRAELAGRSEIPNVTTVTDTKGRKQPAAKPKAQPKRPKTLLIDDEETVKESNKHNRADKIEAGRNARLAKAAEISAGNRELDIAVRYPILYADPPWRYENPPMGSTSRSIENHYPTMTLEQICALPVSDLAQNDAVLFLWATAPKLAECIDVIRAWNFEYRTNIVWDKEKIGMGYYARNQHELLLIARRGNFPPPAPETLPGSVYREPRGEHSVKPEYYRDLIDRFYPGVPKIELFARSSRSGWAAWGNQAAPADA